MMMVYVLISERTGKYYVGITNDLEDRLTRHNQGRSKATKTGLPWTVVATFPVESRSEAMALERKIKGRGAKRFLDEL